MSDETSPSTPPVLAGLTRRHVLAGGAAATVALAFTSLPTGLAGAQAEPLHPDGEDTPGPEGDEGSIEGPTPHSAPPPQSRFGPALSESPDRRIMFPLLGRPNNSSTWSDSYGACRSGCARRHEGQDLIAPRMTKILSCVGGTIVEFRHRPQSSGNSLYVRGDDGWFYAYLHINNDTPGGSPANNDQNRPEHAWGPRLRQFAGNEAAARGHRVERGEHIAYVGDSGNAAGGVNHLHFEIRKPASGSYSSETTRMWASSAVNPKVSLQRAQPAREAGSVPSTAFRPYNNSADFVRRQYRDLLGRPATNGDLGTWCPQLDSGTFSPERLMQYFLESSEADTKTQAVGRLYQAFFLRLPDTPGFAYWVGERRRGVSIGRIATLMSRSGEFTRLYGNLNNASFVDRIYRNVLGRAPDAQGRAFWIRELNRGVSRGMVMIQFSNSAENKATRLMAMHVVAAYGCMLRRMPTPQELFTWMGHFGSPGASTRDMVALLRMDSRYPAS